MSKKHPLVIIREELKLSRRELALACDITYAAIYRTERGYVWRVPARVLAFLSELNFDGQQIQWAHQEWVQGLGEEVRQRVFEAETGPQHG